jgi:hypothetical protein
VRQIVLGAQEQIATFLASGGAAVTQPEPDAFFDGLLDIARLEDLDYLP